MVMGNTKVGFRLNAAMVDLLTCSYWWHLLLLREDRSLTNPTQTNYSIFADSRARPTQRYNDASKNEATRKCLIQNHNQLFVSNVDDDMIYMHFSSM